MTHPAPVRNRAKHAISKWRWGVVFGFVWIGLLAGHPLAAYEVLSFSKTGDSDAIADASNSGDENPFYLDIHAEPDSPQFGSSTSSEGRVELVFRLLEPTIIWLEGELSLVREGYGGAEASLMLSDVTEPADPVLLFEARFAGYPPEYDACSFDPPCDPPVDFSHTLGPGDYALVSEAYGDAVFGVFLGHSISGSGAGYVDVSMTRLPVPEPSSGMSLIAGLPVVAALARKRRRAQTGLARV